MRLVDGRTAFWSQEGNTIGLAALAFVVALVTLGAPPAGTPAVERLLFALAVSAIWLPGVALGWWIQSRGLEVATAGVRITTMAGATDPIPWAEMTAAIVPADGLEGIHRGSGYEWVVVAGARSPRRPIPHLGRSTAWADGAGATNRWSRASYDVASTFEPLVEQLNHLAAEARNRR